MNNQTTQSQVGTMEIKASLNIGSEDAKNGVNFKDLFDSGPNNSAISEASPEISQSSGIGLEVTNQDHGKVQAVTAIDFQQMHGIIISEASEQTLFDLPEHS